MCLAGRNTIWKNRALHTFRGSVPTETPKAREGSRPTMPDRITALATTGESETVELRERRRVCWSGCLRRPLGGHIVRQLHFGLTPEKLFAPHESLPWESVDCPYLLPARHHRGMGTRNPQDGGGDGLRRSAEPRDRGCRRVRNGTFSAQSECFPWTARYGRTDRSNRQFSCCWNKLFKPCRYARYTPVWGQKPTEGEYGKILPF